MHESGYWGGYDESKPEEKNEYDESKPEEKNEYDESKPEENNEYKGWGVNENGIDERVDYLKPDYYSSGNYSSDRITGFDNPIDREGIINGNEVDSNYDGVNKAAFEEALRENTAKLDGLIKRSKEAATQIEEQRESIEKQRERIKEIANRIQEQTKLILEELENKSVGDRQLDSHAMPQQDNNKVTSNLQQSSGEKDLNYEDRWGFMRQNRQDATGGDR